MIVCPKAIYWTAKACLSIREDVDEELLEEFEEVVAPAHAVASLHAVENEQNGIAESPLGQLYDDLYVVSGGNVSERKARRFSAKGNTLTQKLKNVAGVPLASLKKAIKELIDDEEEDDSLELSEEAIMQANERAASKRIDQGSHLARKRQSVLRKQTEGLVGDVLEMLQQKEEEEAAQALREEELREQQQRYEAEIKAGILSLEGHLDKEVLPLICGKTVTSNSLLGKMLAPKVLGCHTL